MFHNVVIIAMTVKIIIIISKTPIYVGCNIVPCSVVLIPNLSHFHLFDTCLMILYVLKFFCLADQSCLLSVSIRSKTHKKYYLLV